MRHEDKLRIREALRAYVEKYPSQNKAALSLKGISAATLSTILNVEDAPISDAMWAQVAVQIGATESDWNIVETGNYIEVSQALLDAQGMRNVLWIVGDAGCGKTTAARSYSQQHRSAYYILCAEDMKRGDFVREVGRVCGVKTEGMTVRDMWQVILEALVQLDRPLLIFDEADKLTDNVFAYFVSMYNKLEDHAGVVFLSTDYIKNRMRRGLNSNKRGYKEIYSRIGRKFYDLDPATAADVAEVCRANGVTDEADIKRVCVEAGTGADSWKPSRHLSAVVTEYDFRRVKKSVRRTIMMRADHVQ